VLRFIQSTTEGTVALSERLITELAAGKNVLWLVPGGSNITTAVAIMAQIPAELTPKLTVGLTDERFGPIGHPDSNWQQLDEAGFDSKQATRVPILAGFDDMDATVAAYTTTLQSLIARNQIIIGYFGMGPDGHIAGILPHTAAVTAEGLVAGYHTDTFDRITGTFAAIRHCTVAYVFAFGEAKRGALQNLQQDLSLEDQPAQIIKQLSEAYVYNDQLGGNE
jgi:6-phosphogluconolactonase/glucosamine-6-phosphate isomerase/deaminase